MTWDGIAPEPGDSVRLFEQDGSVCVATPAYEPLGHLDEELHGLGVSLIEATIASDNRKLDLLAFGPTAIRPED